MAQKMTGPLNFKLFLRYKLENHKHFDGKKNLIRFAALNYNLKRDKNEPISWVVIRFNLSK